MHIITSASTISEMWDEAPGMFSITLSEEVIKRIKELHAMIEGTTDINAIEMRLYGQTWSSATDLCCIEDPDTNECYFSPENCDLLDEQPLKAIENEGGIAKLMLYLASTAESQRVEFQAVNIWPHGTVQFQAIPKHCGDGMTVQSLTLNVKDLVLNDIYIDGV